MHDLNTIAKVNTEAVLRDIKKEQAAGKFVVVEYNGLHYVSNTVHASQGEAEAKAVEVNSHVGSRANVHYPTNLAA